MKMALDLFRALYGMPWRGVLTVLLIAGTLVFALWLFPAASRKTGSPNNKVVDLQKAYTREQFGRVLEAWSATNNDAVGIMKRENIQKLDFIFPALYGFALAFTYAVLSGRRQPTALDLVLFLLPLVAALFDYAENTMHLRLLAGIDTGEDVAKAIGERRFSESAVFLASAFAHAKYVLLGISVLAIAWEAVVRVKGA